ncbi:hypothetical protein L1987_07976 [Smallanthus sonchifolius]|uniref:Uncharacterized protein n=1 Tax=Smallanthus sonchifolius TaxID=185202 RepID=A0ACB9JJS0_9ASTR|nr:hypothetical protein L1987_07976 [Smallanthus sonchifolius]
MLNEEALFYVCSDEHAMLQIDYCMKGAKSVTNYEIDDAQNDDNQFSKNDADSEDVLAGSMIKLHSAQEAFQNGNISITIFANILTKRSANYS